MAAQQSYETESISDTYSESSRTTGSNDDGVVSKEALNDIDVNREDGELIFSPFNPLNKEITDNFIQSILEKYDIPSSHIFNLNLYKRAFVHKSYVKRPFLENEANNVIIEEKPDNCMPLKTKSNERLEFLGDGVLECITKYYLYKRFPKANEGFMTEKKIALVKNEHIGRLAYEMGLHQYYIISKHAEEKKIRTNLKKLGCLFEAFLGALFLDFNKISIHDDDEWFDSKFTTGPGFQMAQIFVESIFEKHVNWVNLIKQDDNYKNILQVKIQKIFKITPTYMIISENEETGYEVGVFLVMNIPIENIKPENASCKSNLDMNFLKEKFDEDHNISMFYLLGSSKHKIKKKAEQTACEIALKSYFSDM